MSRRNRRVGKCRICGQNGNLTYEHVPPKAAFNNFKHFYSSGLEQILKNNKSTDFREITELDLKEAKKNQGGIGFYTLCKKCNNNTGTWYGHEYIRWVYQAYLILKQNKAKPELPYTIPIYPLRIIKQIVSMFLSLNYEEFQEDFPKCKNFVMNKDNTGLDPALRIFCYYNVAGRNRYLANFILGDLNTGKIVHMSEITFAPLGLVMTINSEPHDERLVEITHFSNYRYNEQINYIQKFEVLPTHIPYSVGDYRTEEEIKNDLQKASDFLNQKKS